MYEEVDIYQGPALGSSQIAGNDDPYLLAPVGRQKRGKPKKGKANAKTPKEKDKDKDKDKGNRKPAKSSSEKVSDTEVESQYVPPVVTEELLLFLESFDRKPLPNLDLSQQGLERIPLLFAKKTAEVILCADISHNQLSNLPLTLQLPNLQELNLSSNNFQSFELRFPLPSLTLLDLSCNKMGKFPSPEALDYLPALRTLNLFDNVLTAIPTRSFEKLTKLESFNLSFNKLTSIPKEISALCSLRILLLDKNNLRELPDSITQLNLEDSTFEISGNRLSYPPQEVADRGFSAVKRYIQLLQQEQQSRLSEFPITTAPIASSQPMAQPIPLNTPIPKRRKSLRVNDEISHDPAIEQPTRSSQYKLIVVGREGAGKTSTIRFLTRNIVKVLGGAHEEENFPHPRYGKLIDVYDSDRYIVRLFSTNSEIICRAEHIRLATSVDADLFDYDSVGPPHSTIGIDIDVWKPAITYSLLQSQCLTSSSPFIETQQLDRSVPHGLKSYASVLLSNPTQSGSQISQNSSTKRDHNWSRISLPISEGFGIYESRYEGCYSGETHGTGSKPSSYRKVVRGMKTDLLKADKRPTLEEKPPVDLTLSIWDFAGQDIYHSAHEVFFSPRALYLVVWDMTQNTTKHFDECVQFWIDLIQIRAPGSTIIIVGTKSDLIGGTEIQRTISRLRKHLDDHEALRISAIKKESKKSPMLQRLMKQRPITRILPVSCTSTLAGFNDLTKLILELSTPTSKNLNPFQLVNIEIPRYYLEVKEEVESMLRTCSVTNMEQLHENMKERRKKSSQRIGSEMSINDTRDAVTFLSSIGEVVWFGSRHNKNSRQRVKSKEYTSMEIVAIEESLYSDNQMPDAPTLMSLRNQISGTSVQSDVSCNLDGYYSDNCSSNMRMSEGESDTWRDVGGSESEKNLQSDPDRSQSRKPISINLADDLSEIIFLSPHWLLQSMKKVLTHHLENDIQSIIRSLDERAKQKYFGEYSSEYIPNGIVRWIFIEEKILKEIDLPPDDPQLRRVILTALRSLLTKFDIIIPLDMSPSNSQHQDPHDSDPDYFLIPSLLSPLNVPSIPQYAAPGYVKLERRYVLDKFIPPGLLQRIMARTYFKFGSTRLSFHDTALLTKNCWKYAFHQGFHETSCDVIDIWVWLDTEANCVRLVGFGNIFMSQEIIQRLDKYSQAVADILATFPGLCNIGEIILCPVCIMHQRSAHQCGSFTSDEILSLKKTLKHLEHRNHNHIAPASGDLDSTSNLRKKSCSMDSECSEPLCTDHSRNLLTWRHMKLTCHKHLCGVDSNLLVTIPKSLEMQRNFNQHSEFTIEFLMEELVRLNSVPSSALENCVCKVGHAVSLSTNFDNCVKAIQEYYINGTVPKESLSLFANINDQASGVCVSLPHEESTSHTSTKVVLGCEHVMYGKKESNGCSNYFLVGGQHISHLADYRLIFPTDEQNWLYFAILIFKGSDYAHGSRELFQSGKDCPLLSSPLFSSVPMSNHRTSGPQKLFDRKIWDVAALSIVCSIKPVPMTSTNFPIQLLLSDESPLSEWYKPSVTMAAVDEASPSSRVCSKGESTKEKKKCKPRSFIEIAHHSPAVEQSLRLIGYQHMMSLSVTWGRVMQTNANGLIMANLYGDSGTSGGAIIDRDGKLIGILSMSVTDKRVAYIEPVGPICRVLAKHRFIGRQKLHFQEKCEYCTAPKIAENRLSFPLDTLPR